MGAFMSQPLDRGEVVAPPEVTAPAKLAPLSASEAPASPARGQRFNSCWSCRVLSGSGLIGAGLYVCSAARRRMKLGYTPNPGSATQMVVGVSIAAWGLIILADPKRKAYRTD
ncbi:distal membrane-arm assembly complex protein 1 [Trichechus manatus latirostris]|uniref:Distal membrane-arm assembly complex protein 1 n=1 Tax=Trichechus manatus latirostris TaxID=127582 RepID=A0A2Y9DFS5_TRIMA|nr:distal membrane-arm assembly complex protein 1 [Trichechus manatus latirostris]